MQLGLINSAWAQAGRDTAYGIRMTREIGFDTIDIFADPLDMGVKERLLIRRECERAGLPIVSVACVAVGLLDFNPSVQRFHLHRCRQYLDLACEFRARNLLLVLGEYIWERQVIPPAEQWRTAVANVRELGTYAADLDLQLALELEPFRLSLLNNVDSMVRFPGTPIIVTVLRSNFFVRSALAVHVSPRFSDLKSRLPPSHTMLGLCGDSMKGVFQLNRYASSLSVEFSTFGVPPRPPPPPACGTAGAWAGGVPGLAAVAVAAGC